MRFTVLLLSTCASFTWFDPRGNFAPWVFSLLSTARETEALGQLASLPAPGPCTGPHCHRPPTPFHAPSVPPRLEDSHRQVLYTPPSLISSENHHCPQGQSPLLRFFPLCRPNPISPLPWRQNSFEEPHLCIDCTSHPWQPAPSPLAPLPCWPRRSLRCHSSRVNRLPSSTWHRGGGGTLSLGTPPSLGLGDPPSPGLLPTQVPWLCLPGHKAWGPGASVLLPTLLPRGPSPKALHATSKLVYVVI